MEWQKLMRRDKLRDGHLVVGRAGIRQVAVVRIDGQLYAFKNTCPHAGSPLSGGTLAGHYVECARHQWRFDVRDGGCPAHPTYSLRLYDVRERDEWIEVREQEAEIW